MAHEQAGMEVSRYYNGVRRQRTTICCSAVALILAAVAALRAQDLAAELSLFPVQTLWTISLPAAVAGAPATDDRYAYFRIGEGALAAYDLHGGSQRWTVAAGSVIPSAAGDDLVFAADADAIHAYRAESGVATWRLPIASPLAVPMQWESGWLVAGTDSGTLLAIRALDGQVIWQRELGAPLGARPTIAGEQLLLPIADGLTAVQLRTGEQLWQTRFGGPAHEVLAVRGRLYAGSTDNHLYCLDARTGRIEWRFRTGADAVGLPAADDERVYFVALDNVLRGLDLGNGAQRWKRPLPVRPSAGPLRIGSLLLVNGLGPVLLTFNTRDGTPGGEHTAPGDLVVPPLPVKGAVPPAIVMVARDIAKGDTLQAIARAIEPPLQPLAPLPNLVLFNPPASSTPKPLPTDPREKP
jgi:outer membrane protein assembly factor BamB